MPLIKMQQEVYQAARSKESVTAISTLIQHGMRQPLEWLVTERRMKTVLVPYVSCLCPRTTSIYTQETTPFVHTGSRLIRHISCRYARAVAYDHWSRQASELVITVLWARDIMESVSCNSMVNPGPLLAM